MINNSPADFLILVKSGTEFDCVTPDVLQTLKVKGQGHSVKMSSECQIIAPFYKIEVAESNDSVRILIRSRPTDPPVLIALL